MCRVVVAERNARFRARLVEYLSSKSGIEIVGYAEDGSETESVLAQTKPDLLLLDMVMPRMDGLAVLSRMRENPAMRDINVIVMTQLINDVLIREVAAYGVLFYMIKPFEMDSLLNKIRLLGGIEEKRAARAPYPNPAQLVTQAGISAACKGYRYLCESLDVIRFEQGIGGVTKVIYPQVAKRCGVNATNVERAIRCAIEKAWRSGGIKQSGMFVQTARPTNAEMIATLASRMHSQASSAPLKS